MTTTGALSDARQRLARFVEAPDKHALVGQAAAGEAAAIVDVAAQTGIDPADVRSLAHDLVDKSAKKRARAKKLVEQSPAHDAAQGGVNAGGTARHLGGFRDVPLVDNPVIAQGLAAVIGGLPLELLAEPLRAQVAALLEGGVDEARTRAGAKKAYERASKAIGEKTVQAAIGQLAVAANDLAHAAAPGKLRTMNDVDVRDWHRTWGLVLLPHDDKAFRDPSYLMALNQESGQVQSHFQGRETLSQAKKRFETAWQALSPETRPIAFTDSGSDAVSLCFDIARACGRQRLGVSYRDDAREWGIAHFEGGYGGGRGLAQGMNWEHYNAQNRANLTHHKLPDCSSTSLAPTDPAERARLDVAEAEALAKLRAMASDETRPIGAIMLEPVLGSKGARVYRKGFVEKLRALADELKLPLIFDEVLTSGGRTGRFFAYEHYGVQPDFVTFGKGMQACGIASVQRPFETGRASFFTTMGITTTEADAVRLLKGAVVLERIKEGGLVDNAREVGGYLVEQLRELQAQRGETVEASGLGMLLGVGMSLWGPVTGADGGGRTRLMPPLTLSKADVDAVIAELRGRDR